MSASVENFDEEVENRACHQSFYLEIVYSSLSAYYHSVLRQISQSQTFLLTILTHEELVESKNPRVEYSQSRILCLTILTREELVENKNTKLRYLD